MSTENEGHFSPVSGIKLYSKIWTPASPIKAKLVFVHGYSEHINRYNTFFAVLAEQGIQVLSWDQRGWGRSAVNKSEWGNSGPTATVIGDIAAFVQKQLDDKVNDVPVFVMGHSMGGGEVCTLMGDKQYEDLVGNVRGWLLECPFIGFTAGEEPSAIKVALGRFVGKLLPKRQLKHVVPPEYLSRDPSVVESVRNDPLCHNTGTLEGLAAMLDRSVMLMTGSLPALPCVRSLWLAHGTDDKTCSYDAAMKWLGEQEAVQDKEGKSYEGAYHQLHADHCKEEYARDLVAWVLQRSGETDGGEVTTEQTTIEPKL